MAFLGSIGDGIASIFGSDDAGSAWSLPFAANDMWGGGNARQVAFGREQMNWQSEENKLDRDWQEEFYKQQSDISFDKWRKQFDLTNAYNTPEAVVKRLQAAGINPNVLFSGGSGASLGGNSSATPAMQGVGAGGSHSVSPVGLPHSSPVHISSVLNSIGTVVKDIAEAKKLGADTELLERTINDQIRKWKADADSAELGNAMAEIQNDIMSQTKDLKVKQEYWRLQNYISDNYQKLSQGDKNVQDTATSMAEELVHRATANKINIDAGWVDRLNRSVVALNKAKAEEAGTQASVNSATKEQLDFFNKMREDEDVRKSLYNEVIAAGNKAIADSKISKTQVNIINEQLKQAIFATDMQQVTYWTNLAFNTIESVGKGVSAFYGAGALKQLIELRGAAPNPLSRPLESGKGFYMDGGLLFKQ